MGKGQLLQKLVGQVIAIHTILQHFGSNLQHTWGGIGIPEASRIRQKPGVNTVRQRLRPVDGEKRRQIVQHLRRSGSVGPDQVDPAKAVVSGVVINIQNRRTGPEPFLD
ncbi:hypothetical protein D3C75_976430 [compost metagenome]